jgi:hypothetical protein
VERGKPKCDRYWPSLDTSETYGDRLRVTNVSETPSHDYTLREFLFKRVDGGGVAKGTSSKRKAEEQEEERKIYHYHFTVSTV